MTPEPPSEPLDLLVVGGLTIDRFADGTNAPGGAVMHIAHSAAGQGLRVGVVTTAGPEPLAADAVAELRSMAGAVAVTSWESFSYSASSCMRARIRGTSSLVALRTSEPGIPA